MRPQVQRRRMIQDHPVVVWSGIALTVLSLLSGLAYGWWFLADYRQRDISAIEMDREHYQKELARLAEIRREQESIRRELATQSTSLQAIQRSQDALEQDHKWIVTEINRVGFGRQIMGDPKED